MLQYAFSNKVATGLSKWPERRIGSIRAIHWKITGNIVFLLFSLGSQVRNLLHSFRRSLTNCGSILAYSLLRIVEGVASGSIVLVFDLAISNLSLIWSVGNHGEGFEALPPELDATDVTESGIQRWTIAPLSMQATIRQAMHTIAASTAETVCIYERSRSSGKQIPHGIVTRESIEKFSLASVL